MEKDSYMNIVDQIYCINLLERHDRYVETYRVFKSLGVIVNFYRTSRDSNGGRGCFNSHVNVCRDAIRCGFNKIAIFEDDILLNNTPQNVKKAFTRIGNFLRFKRNWDVFHLGCFPDNRNDTHPTLFQNIYKVKAYGAHAYILNRSSIQRIASLRWEGRDYDGYLMDTRQYA